MSRKTIKAFESHTGRKSPGAQGVTFRDARKPGLGPSRRDPGISRGIAAMIRDGNKFATTGCPECDEEIRTGKPCPVEGGHTCDTPEETQEERAATLKANRSMRNREIEVTDTGLRYAPTLPPPPVSVERACMLARAQELEDTARMMLARAAELREVAAKSWRPF